jgi:sulfotransferase family protein
MNPYVFIVGCARSGTTLLQRLINAHSQIAITPESHWICRLFEQNRGLTQEGMVTPELVPLLLEDLNPRFVRLNIGQEELLNLVASDRPVHYASFISGIFDLYGKAKGKELVGNKTPGFVRKIHTLHALWPQARIVHLIRDGRDVCLSMINRPLHHVNRGPLCTWAQDPVTTAGLWWEWSVKLGRQAGNSLGSRLYYEMRYESLVAQPAEECTALCRFLGLPYQEEMLHFHEGRKRIAPPSDAKHAWLPSTGDAPEFRLRPITVGLRDWRSQMSHEDVERFEAAAGGLLDELGYPHAFSRLPPERLEKASRIRELLALGSRARKVEKVESEASP